jgi:aldehyde:ferredoxin oxidoreductase
MRIHEILAENIFTCDYHKVMDAVSELYKNHYEINIWDHAEAHDDAAKVLMKEHPTIEELDFIIKNGDLPERFVELDFPINDELMFGVSSQDSLEEEPATRKLCKSGKPDSALGASQLASCKSQGYRGRDGGKSHKIGSDRVKVRGKKIKGRKYGGPLPDWS